MRYETSDEYDGLLRAMQDTIEKPFRENVPAGEPIVQLAEPFDGVDHSYLITPLLADYIQSLGYRVVCLVGRNSGPKFGNNLLDLAKTLNATFAMGNKNFGEPKPPFGWYVNQQDLSHAVDRWVEIRRQTIKRPFLSTLERFLNPAKAQICIASAFHPPYTEKMITICERAGFAGGVIVRNGLEGTLAGYLNRPLKMMCSLRSCVDEYTRKEFEVDPKEILGCEIKIDEQIRQPSLEENARLICTYKEKGGSGKEQFDFRVKVCCHAVKQVLDWLKISIVNE